jgi:hypothetical protein
MLRAATSIMRTPSLYKFAVAGRNKAGTRSQLATYFSLFIEAPALPGRPKFAESKHR